MKPVIQFCFFIKLPYLPCPFFHKYVSNSHGRTGNRAAFLRAIPDCHVILHQIYKLFKFNIFQFFRAFLSLSAHRLLSDAFCNHMFLVLFCRKHIDSCIRCMAFQLHRSWHSAQQASIDYKCHNFPNIQLCYNALAFFQTTLVFPDVHRKMLHCTLP